MSKLDAKLDYILKSNAAVQVFYDKDSMVDYDKLIPAIKQAFKDEGWLDPEMKDVFIDQAILTAKRALTNNSNSETIQ